MPRLAKAAVHAALDIAAHNVKSADRNYNEITSRKEMKAKLETIADSTERTMTSVFYEYAHHRGSRVTGKLVDDTLAFYKARGIDAKDKGQPGLSKKDFEKITWLGQLAAEMARKNAPDKKAALTTEELKAAFAAPAQKALYISEGDYNPTFTSTPFSGEMTGPNVWAALQPIVTKFYTDDGNDLTGTTLTYEMDDATKSAIFVKELGEPGSDDDDDFYKEINEGWTAIAKLFKDSLKDVRVVRVGPKEEDSADMATDQGLYVYAVVGKTKDGNLAGMLFGSVET